MPVDRRSFLKTGLGAGSLFLPLPYAWVWAQSEGAVKLLRLPKIALVFGNSKYKDAPLKNPANDARAISEALTASGFSVTARLDASRADMAAALDAYVKELASKKCVGFFYYAGHGVQLQWKNYMLPVDAEIDTVDDVEKKAVEVNSLMSGLTRAANPLNVIILDACRDNPFGTAKPTQAKGLSQMDAPNQTLLAYATAPGNVASDGEGANGLYTESFLKEMKVPEAKLEDVFKRVRLSVRRRSNGAQVPWESTSLEDDFWFIPPKELKKLSDSEKDKLAREERAIWEKVEKAAELGPVEDYLRRYPNGDYAELAQLKLDRLLARQGEKKVEIAKQEGNPFTKGSAIANTAFKVGDTYSARTFDMNTKVERGSGTGTITQITDDEVIYSHGLVTDLLGNARRLPNGRRLFGDQSVPLEYSIGKRWHTRYDVAHETMGAIVVKLDFRIAAREMVTVPAGTFNAFRIEAEGASFHSNGVTQIRRKIWRDPDKVRVVVANENTEHNRGRLVQNDRRELTAYKES